MTSSWRAGIYARVSTAQQAAEGKTSIDDQLRRCRAVAEREGWDITGEYVDPGISGEELDARPQLQQLLADCEAGRLDVVVAIDTDRLARDELVFFRIFRALDRAEVAVHADGQLYRPDNLSQLLTRGVKAVVSSHEKRSLVTKMALGQRARARAGGWPGGATPYGYRLAYTDASRLAQVEIDEAEAEVLRLAVALLVDEGMSTGQACSRLNELGYRTRNSSPWAHQNLRRMLLSETLLGRVAWGKGDRRRDGHRTKVRRDGTPVYGEAVEIALPPIISEERWEALQRALSRRAYGTKRASKPYPLSGAVSACGASLGGVWRADRDLRQYRCSRAKWTSTGEPRCDCPRLDANRLDARVWSAVSALLADPDQLARMAADHLGERANAKPGQARRIMEVERRIASLEQARVQRAADALAAGLDPALIRAAVAKIEGDLAGLVAERDRLAAQRANDQRAEEQAQAIAQLAKRAATRLPGMGLEQQRQVLELLGVRVTVLDQTTDPRLRIEGPDIFGGGQLFPEPDPDGDPGDRTPRRPAPRVTIPFALAA